MTRGPSIGKPGGGGGIGGGGLPCANDNILIKENRIEAKIILVFIFI
ncbi:MAG: hypothetical protein HKN00_13580 [Flavobacteriaceae bacterium]|nr:hypothetical protein [Bacteroidia bacterium]NNF76210.1 hypothetical protein [Flavobacteriaceae bacterium]NNK72892.1 hypothetical protein [Flavobacteriaceae bacterium]